MSNSTEVEATLGASKEEQQPSASSEMAEFQNSQTGNEIMEVLAGDKMESVLDAKDPLDSFDVNKSEDAKHGAETEPEGSDFLGGFAAIAEAVGLVPTASLKKGPRRRSAPIPIPQMRGGVNKTSPENSRRALREYFENGNTPTTGGIDYELIKAMENFTVDEAKACLDEEEKHSGKST